MRVLSALAIVVVLVPFLLLVSLQLEPVRSGLATWVSDRLESAAGVGFRAQEVELKPLRGVVAIRGLQVFATGHASNPFARADGVRLAIELPALLDRRVILRELTLERPQLLPRAPLPARTTKPDEGTRAWEVELRSLEIREGALESGAPGAPADRWIGAWRLSGIEARGSFVAGHATLAVQKATVRVERPGLAPIMADVAADLAANLDGTIDVPRFEARGAGLTLDAHGRGTVGDDVQLEATYDLACELALLAPASFTRGSLAAKGTLAFGTAASGTVAFDVRRAPADVASRFVTLTLPPTLQLAGTEVDLAGELQFDLSGTRLPETFPADAVTGHASGAWRRGERHLIDASFASAAETGSNHGARVTGEAVLLPAIPGERRVKGIVRVPSWSDPIAAEIVDLRARVVEPDIDAALTRFAIRRTRDANAPSLGGIDARLEATGAIAAPRLRLDADWTREGETYATVSAQTAAGLAWNRGVPPVDFDVLLLPAMPGVRQASGRLSGTTLDATTVHVELPDLGAAVVDLARRLGTALPETSRPLDELLKGGFAADAQVHGPLLEPHASVQAAWHPGAGAVLVDASGVLFAHAPYYGLDHEATLSVKDIDAAPFGAPGVVIHALDATSDGTSVDVSNLRASLPSITPGGPAGELSGEGRFDIAWPPRTAEARLQLDHPYDAVDRVAATARLADGVLHADRVELESGGSTAVANAEVPLASLAPFAGPLKELFAGYAAGPVRLKLEPAAVGVLAPFLNLPANVPVPRGTIEANLDLTADDLLASSGSLQIRDLGLQFEGRTITTDDVIRVDVRDGRVELSKARFLATAPEIPEPMPIDVSGSLGFARDWHPGQPFAAMVRDFAFDLHGDLDAQVLTLRIPNTSGTGRLRVDATVRGPLDKATGEVRVSGPDTRISIFSQYPTRFEAPEVRLTVRDGALVIDSVKARWNGGDVELSGRVKPGPEAVLEATFGKVSYRLPLGATAQVAGKVQFDVPAAGRPALKGNVVVQRASLRRNIVLDKEVLRAILEPDSLGENPYLDTIDLDLAIATDLGLKIKNNVADLHADWDRLEVSGTAAAPKLSGRVTVEPGGMVNFLGNILRIDEGTLSWAGTPPGSPIIALRTTSSLDDASIKSQWYRYGTWYEPPMLGPGRGGTLDLSKTQASSTENLDAFAAGIATYSRDRIAGALSGGVTQTEFGFQPLPLFGETDTTARMTLTQQLPPNAIFIASTSPTDAEAQTYIVDLHGFDFAPSLRAQIFTNDEKHEGITLQQTVRFGKAPQETDLGPRLGKVTIEVPEGIKKGKLKKAISYRPGDPLGDGARLDIELDVVDAMRSMGYPTAQVSVEKSAPREQKLDLLVRVDPGQKVETVFEGDRPRKPARRAIASLYRLGNEEASSIEEIRLETTRALQERGFFSPAVTVNVMRDAAAAKVTLHIVAEGGREVDPEAPVFTGVEPAEAAALSALFPSRFSRISLATGAAGTDPRVLRMLAEAGYPSAKISSRTLSDDGTKLVVQVDPGPQQKIASVAILGLPPDETKRLEGLLPVRAGDPARAERIAGSIQVIEKTLRKQGFTRVEVRPRREAVSPDRPLDFALSFDVDAGPQFTVQSVTFTGLTNSDLDWVRKLVGISTGTPVDPDQLAAARAQLTRTGVFQEVRVTTEPVKEAAPQAAEPVALPAASVPSTVRFDVKERQRWQLAYGGRYETEVGFGAVVDLYNFNSLGRGRTTGVRAVYDPQETSVRLYHLIPNVFGGQSSLDAFAEWKKELVEGVESQGVEGWVQVGFPLSKRWQTRVYTVLEKRKLTDETPDPNTPLDQRVISPRFGWQLAFDSRVAPPGNPQRRRGFFYGLNLVGAHEALGSDLTGLQTSQQWVFYMPLGNRDTGLFTWAHSYRFSTINVSGEDVPYDNRLRIGGEFSVRGYRTNSLGPRDAEGDALGGEVLFNLNEELHLHVNSQLSAVVFFDAGNVWPTWKEFDWSLSRSAGVGARWSSPIGPLRLDVAWPIDRRENDDTYKVYLGFGTLF